MKNIIICLVVLFISSCSLIGESEFKHMPTYNKTVMYVDSEKTIYMIEEFDGYINSIYYIDQNDNIVNINL